MCFTISGSSRKAKVATKNIVCYKVLIDNGGHWRSPFQYETYFRDKLGKSCLKRVTNFTWEGSTYSIYRGLHSHSTLETAQVQAKGREVFKAIIPKGTRYFYNSRSNEYVSLALRVYNKVIE